MIVNQVLLIRGPFPQIPISIFKNACVCMCVYVWKSGENLWELVFSFFDVGLWVLTHLTFIHCAISRVPFSVFDIKISAPFFIKE